MGDARSTNLMIRRNAALRLFGICRFLGWIAVYALFAASAFALTIAAGALFVVAWR